MKILTRLKSKSFIAAAKFKLLAVLFLTSAINLSFAGASLSGTTISVAGYDYLHKASKSSMLLSVSLFKANEYIGTDYSLNWSAVTGLPNDRTTSEQTVPDASKLLQGIIAPRAATGAAATRSDFTRTGHLPEDLLSLAYDSVATERAAEELSDVASLDEDMSDTEWDVNSAESLPPSGYMMLTTPSTPICSGGGTICSGSSVSVSATSSGATTIYWYTGGCGTTQVFTSSPGVGYSVSPSASTTYYARGYNASGFSTNCCSVLVTVNPLAGGVTAYGGGTQCGGSRTLTATGGTNATIYWQGTQSGGTSTGTPGTSQSVSSSGTYYFRAYNANCGWG
ncbi:MAG TPA: hypothetical protein PKW80_12555, partial [Bacteroidales bacterium]|nr:hypothetical protein [Bacteroidales bacterium]